MRGEAHEVLAPVQNIDPIYFLEPAVIVGFSFGLVAYWRRKRSFTRAVLLYSLVAFAGAIAVKAVLQLATATAVSNQFGFVSIGNGLYLGLQTVFFEVGGAYLVARFAARRGALTSKDGAAYGIALAFWENGILLGVLSLLISLTAIYLTLASGLPAASTLYSTLISTQPSLFFPPDQALPLIGLAVLERFSSAIIHISWGYLCVLAATLNKRGLFLLALPMGLIDVLVVFATTISVSLLEAIIFAISLGFFAVTLLATRGARRELAALAQAPSQSSPDLAVP